MSRRAAAACIAMWVSFSTAACAPPAPAVSASTGSVTSASQQGAERYEPPKLLTVGQPTLRGYWSAEAGREVKPQRIEVRVWVDELGRADLARVAVSGGGASENYQTIRDWLQAAVFQPARKDGQAVGAEFRMILRPQTGS